MKKAIIIGATSGIGKELAKILVKENFKVGITGRRNHYLEELANEQPDRYIASCFDVTNCIQTEQKLNELIEDLQGLDLLIICAGTGELNESLALSIEQETIDVNILGFTTAATIAFHYFMQKGRGHLVGISSIAAIRGNRYAPAYSASKAFQSNYLEALRGKARKLQLDIHITDIQPGFVATKMVKAKDAFWIAPVEKAAKQIYKAIGRKDKKKYITRRWALIALLLKITPSWLYEKL